jgi:integrase
MGIIKNIVKIKGYTGLYFNDTNGIFNKEVSVSQISKKVKPPYIIYSRFYNNRKSVYEKYTILNNAKTVKKILDEISAERKIKQIEKNFKAKNEFKTLNQIFYEWIEFRKSQIAEQHYKNNISFYKKYIQDTIGRYKADDVNIIHIQKIVNFILENRGNSPRTAKTVKDILSPTFKFGIRNNYCRNNPANDINIPKFDNQRYFTIETKQAQKIYDIIIHYPKLSVKGIFIFLLHGRRKKEVLNLKWENINISQKLYTLRDRQNKSRKNLVFPLSNLQIQILKEIGIRDKGYIFTQDNGEPYKDIRWHWDKIREQLDFDIRLHDLRHLIGYIAVNKGISLKAISKTLGHSNIQITERYSNISINMIEETLNTVFDTIENKPSNIEDKISKLKNLFPGKTTDELKKIIDLLK